MRPVAAAAVKVEAEATVVAVVMVEAAGQAAVEAILLRTNS